MMRQPLTVTYRDGTTDEVSATQYSIGAFAIWAAAKGHRTDPNDPGYMAVVQLRYMAYAELQRDSTGKTTFEAWNATVDEVSSNGTTPVDPTQPAISAVS